MKDALIVSALSLVPKNRTARLMGWFARLHLPAWLHRAIVRWFVGKYKLDLSEAVGTLDDYGTLAELFVRPLRPGIRPVDPRPDVLVSPVDARVHTFGTIKAGCFEQAPGRVASVASLLGVGDPRTPTANLEEAVRYEGGTYAVLYLSPRDYHRVHTPFAATITSFRYLAGTLWPVFPAATRQVDELFARNERLVFHLQTAAGTIAEIMVGAFGVGHMSTVLDPTCTNEGEAGRDVHLATPRTLERAEELGRFELGSTVILLAEPGRLEWTLTAGEPVRLGQPIARVLRLDTDAADQPG